LFLRIGIVPVNIHLVADFFFDVFFLAGIFNGCAPASLRALCRLFA
jgi:hypothetical protein